MKHNYLIILLLAVLGVSCSKNEVILTENELPEDIFYLQDEIKPFSGTCLIYYTNTEILKEEFHFKDGVLDGARISFYKNGQIKREGNYISGLYNGTWKVYDEKGNQTMELEYKNDSLYGNFISWHETGVICEKGEYCNNIRKGEWVSYDEAGMIINKSVL